jgi:hypothetical protein
VQCNIDYCGAQITLLCSQKTLAKLIPSKSDGPSPHLGLLYHQAPHGLGFEGISHAVV